MNDRAGHSLLDRRLEAELARIRAADLYRVRRAVSGGHGVDIEVEGRHYVNFCSNDYLGLAADPRPAAAAQRVLARCGTGSGAAALITGYDVEHARLEEALADFLGRPRALLFSSGWAANLGVLRALLGRGDRLIADELNHASLIDGGRLSGAEYVRVLHRDIAGFERALDAAGNRGREPAPGGIGNRDGKDEKRERRTLVVTDSVFSMDGDVADLPSLSQLAQAHGAALMVDDAHGFGVLGINGGGAVEHFFPSPSEACSRPRVPSPDIYIATLGKSLGASGAFVAGSEALIEYLIQRARSWVFSTAPPPAIAAAARESLRVLRAEPERRQRLQDNIRRFRDGARQLGLAAPDTPQSPIANPATPIQPLLLGEAARALALSRALFERGYWVAAIRPPTVPAGTSRLRVTLSATHTAMQIDGLLAALGDALQRLPAAA